MGKLKRGKILFLILLVINVGFVFGSLQSGDGSFSPSATEDFSVVVDNDFPIVIITNPVNITYNNETPIFVNYTVNDLTPDSIWYSINSASNLSISGPLYVDLPEGNYLLVVYANDSFDRIGFDEIIFTVDNSVTSCGDAICELSEDCNSCSVDCGSCSSGGGGGGGGGGGSSTSSGENFTLDKKSINVNLVPGETKTQLLIIENNGNGNLNFELSPTLLIRDFINIRNSNFNLNPGEKEIVVIDFTASENTFPNLYAGSIAVTGGKIRKDVFISIEVESQKNIFNVVLDIPEDFSVINSGEEVLAELKIIDTSNSGEVIDLTIKNVIKDSEGNIIYEENNIIRLDSKSTSIESLKIPFGIKPGKYVFYAQVAYGDAVIMGSDIFEVKNNPLGVAFVLVILAGILIMTAYYLNNKKIKKRRKPKDKTFVVLRDVGDFYSER